MDCTMYTGDLSDNVRCTVCKYNGSEKHMMYVTLLAA